MKVKKITSLVLILLITSMCYSCRKEIATGGNVPTENTTAKNNSTENTTAESTSSEISANPSWKVASIIEDVFPKNTAGFSDKNHGITVGYSGEIHYTNDGGKTWKKGSNNSLCLFGLSIVDSKIAYACGNGSYVIKTLDGGANWSPVTSFGESEPNHPRYISFVDEKTGWVATPNKFEHKGKEVMLGSTTNGGIAWNMIDLPKEIEAIEAIYLRTPDNGYIIDNKNNLYITKDGGKSFTKQPLNIKIGDLSSAFEPEVILRFMDENNAFIAYKDANWKFHASRSSDGGKTWVDDVVPGLTSGAIYLSQDGRTVTLVRPSEFMKILEYK